MTEAVAIQPRWTALAARRPASTWSVDRSRMVGLGSSDMASVVGENPYETAIDLYLSLRARIDGTYEPRPPTPAQEWGTILEKTILSQFAQRQGRFVLGRDEGGSPALYCPSGDIIGAQHPVTLNYVTFPAARLLETLTHPSAGFPLFCHVDGIVLRQEPKDDDDWALMPEAILEAKTASAWLSREWGNDPESDAIPEGYICQIQTQAEIARALGYDLPVRVAALIGGSRWVTFKITPDPGFAELLLKEGMRFWWECVQAERPPPAEPNERGARSLLRLYPRDSGLERMATLEELFLARALRERMDAFNVAQADLEAAEVVLKEKMATCTRLLLGDGVKVEWPYQAGKPRWKDIALDLSGGIVPHAIMEKHRGEGCRVFRKDGLKKLRLAE